jgi:hypothetical protein
VYSITILAIGTFGGYLVGIASGIAAASIYIRRSRVTSNADTTQTGIEVTAVLRKLAAMTADPGVKRAARTPRAPSLRH